MRKVLLSARSICWEGGPTIDLAICEGELVAILGESGTGKSRLLLIICLIQPLSAGDLIWEGRLMDPAQEPIQRRIGFFPVSAAKRPRLLLADEPGPAAMRRLKDLNERSGQTVLLATRDPEIAIQCPTIYRLSKAGLRRLC